MKLLVCSVANTQFFSVGSIVTLIRLHNLLQLITHDCNVHVHV